MSHHNTVFSQLLKLIPRHEFETLAKQHHTGRAFRKASRWSQFVTMAMGQLSGRDSLRDIIDNMSAKINTCPTYKEDLKCELEYKYLCNL